MSHFSVAVFTSAISLSVADLLAPYDENLKVEPYLEYTREELIRQQWLHTDRFSALSDEELYRLAISDYSPELVCEDGVYSTCNPDAKWDYWQEAEWKPLLLRRRYWKDPEVPEQVSSAPISHVDFARMAKENGPFLTYAVVTPNGQWHAPGEVGWFGISSESKTEYQDWSSGYGARFLDPAILHGWEIHVIDCHI